MVCRLQCKFQISARVKGKGQICLKSVVHLIMGISFLIQITNMNLESNVKVKFTQNLSWHVMPSFLVDVNGSYTECLWFVDDNKGFALLVKLWRQSSRSKMSY